MWDPRARRWQWGRVLGEDAAEDPTLGCRLSEGRSRGLGRGWPRRGTDPLKWECWVASSTAGRSSKIGPEE